MTAKYSNRYTTQCVCPELLEKAKQLLEMDLSASRTIFHLKQFLMSKYYIANLQQKLGTVNFDVSLNLLYVCVCIYIPIAQFGNQREF